MKNDISAYNRSWRNRDYAMADGYDEIEDYHGSGYGHVYGRRLDIDLHEAVDPLIRQIKNYDNYRQVFEQHGGRIKDFAAISKILSQEFTLEGYYGQTKVKLTQPGELRSGLYDIDYGLHLQIRELRSGMPCYYLCRIKNIYHSGYNSLIVEDLYCSPGYPMPDKRIVRLMKAGKEKSFLRLSPFREAIRNRFQDEKKEKPSIERETDRMLYNLGRYVISPAWHEDQFPGMQAACNFNLAQFPQVIELLYLNLSGELCELRSQVDMAMLDFFQNTHPQPAIVDFLMKLKELNGAELNELPKEGLRNYVSLQKAFSHFLSIEIPWGRRKVKKPLNMLLLGNFSRLELVGKALNNYDKAVSAKKLLEREAWNNIYMITRKKGERITK